MKESIEKPIEIKSPQDDKNTTDNYPNWFDRNKLKKIFGTIASNKSNYKNEIGEFKDINIRGLVNNI